MHMQKYLKVSLVAAALGSTPVAAHAADAARPVPRAYDWTGFYAGAHVGWAGDDDSAVIGGGQAGVNYQIGRWVLGLEGELGTSSGNIGWLTMLSARAGWAFDRWLVYGKLGSAWADIDNGDGGRNKRGESDHSSSGWLFGIGAEYVLQNNWTAKFEYNKIDINDSAHVFKVGLNYRFGLGPLPGPGRR